MWCLRKNSASDTQGTVKCDVKFLNAIIEDLDSLALGWVDCLSDKDIAGWQSAYNLVATELQRLGENPDLIHDQEIREEFFTSVKSFCSVVKFRLSQDNQRWQEAVIGAADNYNCERYRKPYDPERVPWHQFLHHLAPGSNASPAGRLNAPRDKGTRQIIPPAGIRLLREWEKDFQKYAEETVPVSKCFSSWQRHVY